MYHSKSATPVDDEKDFEKGRIRSADYDDADNDDDDEDYDDDDAAADDDVNDKKDGSSRPTLTSNMWTLMRVRHFDFENIVWYISLISEHCKRSGCTSRRRLSQNR